MATGDITSTYEGTFTIDSAALLAELDTLNTGAATAGADTTSIEIVSTGNGQVAIFTLARAA